MGSIPRANTPPPVIDKTLSVEGAVAESKAVGDKFNSTILSSPLYKSKFVTGLGIYNCNFGQLATNVITKYQDGSFLVEITFVGHQHSISSNSAFDWLSGNGLTEDAKSLTGKSNYKPTANCFPLLGKGVIPAEEGYSPYVRLTGINGHLRVGRIYEATANLGDYQNSAQHTGNYSFRITLILY